MRKPVRTRRLFAISVLVVVGAASGCSSGGDGRRTDAAESKVGSLTVVQVTTPALQVPNYRTSGTFPQVSSSELDLKTVNASIRTAVLEAQREYGREARQRWRAMPQLFDPDYRESGFYATSPRRNLISASSTVVSTLIPLRAVVAGGTGGETWLSVTVRVPSGSPVGIDDLFTEPARGLEVLAAAVRRRILFANTCVRASVADPVGGKFTGRGLDPTLPNYRHFALTPKGLEIGFPAGQVAAAACNRLSVAVPYSVLRPYLSDLGRKLISGVRRPANPASKN